MRACADSFRVRCRSSISTPTASTPSSTARTGSPISSVAREDSWAWTVVAVTDHGNLHGAWSFYEEAKARKASAPSSASRPIWPSAPGASARRPAGRPPHYSHLVLLAKNRAGYQNLDQALVHRVHRGVLPPPAHRSRGRWSSITKASSASPPVSRARSRSDCGRGTTTQAEGSAEWFARLFGKDGFWLEVQDHGIAGRASGGGRDAPSRPGAGARRRGHQRRALPPARGRRGARRAARHRDRHGPRRPQAVPLHRPGELRQDRAGDAGALRGSSRDRWRRPQRVADLCEFDFEKRYFLPQFPAPRRVRERRSDLLVHLARPWRGGSLRRPRCPAACGAAARPTSWTSSTHAGYAGYFLIVARTSSSAARARGIPGRARARARPPARSSPTRLGITNVDPLKFDLLFERFLNPERVSMPDIDVDFCFERRGRGHRVRPRALRPGLAWGRSSPSGR